MTTRNSNKWIPFKQLCNKKLKFEALMIRDKDTTEGYAAFMTC